MSREKHPKGFPTPNGASASRQSITSPVRGVRSKRSRHCKHPPAAKAEANSRRGIDASSFAERQGNLETIAKSTADVAHSSILALARRVRAEDLPFLTRRQILQSITRTSFAHLKPCDGDGAGAGGGTEAVTAANSLSTPNGPKSKRKQQGGGRGGNDDDDPNSGNGDGRGDNGGGGDGRKRQKQAASETEPGLPWACHFLKLDPRRYHRCEKFQLSRIADIRQHILRKHKQTLYCPTCHAIFGSSEAHQAHLILAGCVPAHGAQPPPGWRPELSHGRSEQTDEDRWYYIWTTLFNDAPKPPSPYLTLGTVEVGVAADVIWEFFQDGNSAAWVNETLGPAATMQLRERLHIRIEELTMTILVAILERATGPR